ncbi:MAG: hypothetical protein IZT55_06305 [Anaerolineae bacterium]|nr:hypothetical protein [Anaerolineae bacterium]
MIPISTKKLAPRQVIFVTRQATKNLNTENGIEDENHTDESCQPYAFGVKYE